MVMSVISSLFSHSLQGEKCVQWSVLVGQLFKTHVAMYLVLKKVPKEPVGNEIFSPLQFKAQIRKVI